MFWKARPEREGLGGINFSPEEKVYLKQIIEQAKAAEQRTESLSSRKDKENQEEQKSPSRRGI